MTKEELLIYLNFWVDSLENPLYDSLEVGFIHSPLTKDEMIQRYKEECYITRNSIMRVIEMIEKDGIE